MAASFCSSLSGNILSVASFAATAKKIILPNFGLQRVELFLLQQNRRCWHYEIFFCGAINAKLWIEMKVIHQNCGLQRLAKKFIGKKPICRGLSRKYSA